MADSTGRAGFHRASARLRPAQRALGAAAAALALLIAAAWAVPPMLDGGRYRTAVAAFVSAAFGREITIGGTVGLQLLPFPVLTASQVTVPDAGDGVSADIAFVRLEVRPLPLLSGHLAVRDLTLDRPVVRLPWPLPDGLANPEQPRAPHAFAAHVENGTLLAGHAEIGGINAAIHGRLEPGFIQDVPATSFGAEGFAAMNGVRWRFTAALGAPNADNVAPLDISILGQGKMARTIILLLATTTNGVLQGRCKASGDDLSLLAPALAQPWRLDAPFTMADGRLESPSTAFTLGDMTATIELAVQTASPAHARASVHVADLDLDAWLHAHPSQAGWPVFLPPAQVAVAADRARMLGRRLSHVTFAIGLRNGQATLDGLHAALDAGTVDFSGSASGNDTGLPEAEGTLSLDASDLLDMLSWLRPVSGGLAGLFENWPASGKHAAKLAAGLRLSRDAPSSVPRVQVSGLGGTIDGTALSGSFDLVLSGRPSLVGKLHAGAVSVEDWVRLWPAAAPGLPAIGAAFPTSHAALDVSVDAANFGGLIVSDLRGRASGAPDGIALTGFSGMADGASFRLSGTVQSDGSVEAGRFAATLPADAVRRWLPRDWRWLAGSGSQAAHLAVSASGPAHALEVQAQGVAGDLAAEAEAQSDTISGNTETTLTLRHPGAPFLLRQMGWPHTETWLGEGPLTLLTHVRSAPGRFAIEDAALAAGDLRLTGSGQLGPGQVFSLDLQSGSLPVPPLDGALLSNLPVAGTFTGWEGGATLSASAVTSGGHTLADRFNANFTASAQNAVLSATASGGALARLTLDAALDASQHPARAAARIAATRLSGAEMIPGLKLPVAGGSANVLFQAESAGDTAADLLQALRGTADFALRHVTVHGLDLARVGQLAASPAPRANLLEALGSGSSENYSGTVSAEVTGPRFSVTDGVLSATDGVLHLQGWTDLLQGETDLRVLAEPALAPGERFTLHFTGPSGSAKESVDVVRK